MRSNGASQETPPIQSLDRGLMILEAVASSEDPVSLSELTSLIGIDRSSVFRLAYTLKRRGFLAYPSGRKDFVLGPAMWRLAQRYDWGTMLVRIAEPHLARLARQANETAHLAIREGRNALFVDHASANHVISISGQSGEMVPLYCTAHGKALLADMTLEELTRLFGAGPLTAHTENTIRSIDELAGQCDEIRANGYAEDNAEYQEGVRCTAAPIRVGNGTVIASIGISAPEQRLSPERFEDCTKLVRKVAADISAELETQIKAEARFKAKARAKAR